MDDRVFVTEKLVALNAIKDRITKLTTSERAQCARYLEACYKQCSDISDDRRFFLRTVHNFDTGKRFWTVGFGYQHRAPQSLGQDLETMLRLLGVSSPKTVPVSAPRKPKVVTRPQATEGPKQWKPAFPKSQSIQ